MSVGNVNEYGSKASAQNGQRVGGEQREKVLCMANSVVVDKGREGGGERSACRSAQNAPTD